MVSRSEAIKKAWRRRRREVTSRDICPYCRKPVFTRGVKHNAQKYHKQCYYIVFVRTPRGNHRERRIRRLRKR